MGEAAVRLEAVRKRYGSVGAVDGVSLAAASGEIVSLLGPSGCGKTTTLRMVAGFVTPDEGDVFVFGRRVTDVPASRRDVAMVFQGYALFPHMTVEGNVAFGLRMRKASAADISAAVTQCLAVVRLSGYEQRMPSQLSGGQQQRVALARALVVRPRVLLLDEPLSNLDAKLRQEMRVELKRILKSTGVATLFVTHDQEEALTLSDRIVLMNRGVVEQEGSPEAIYERPATRFAAEFIGQANFFFGTVAGREPDGRVVVDCGGARLEGRAQADLAVGAPALVVVRQERVRLLGPGDGQGIANRVPARLDFVNYLGAGAQLVCTAGGRTVTAVVGAPVPAEVRRAGGGPVMLGWTAGDALVLADEGGAR